MGFLFTLAWPTGVFAYGIDTHEGLTRETIKFYNEHFTDNRIDEKHFDFLAEGSRREDDPARWLNHFYDPVYNRGLESNIYGDGIMSKAWAQSDKLQTGIKHDPFFATILSSIQQKKIQKYFPASNFTWNEAIRYWLNGNEEMAMFSLGHIVHLIQDASVPDHTRNDPHPPLDGGSPYEDWAKQYNSETIDLSENLKDKEPINLDILGEYFDSIASYSNNNFYSKDTIGVNSGYDFPAPNDLQRVDNYFFAYLNQGGDNILLFKQPDVSSILFVSKNEIIFDDPDVMQNYWSRLSTKAVQHGAGVIDLFFKEVKRAQLDPNFEKDLRPTGMKVAIAKAADLVGAAVSAVENAVGYASDTIGGLFNDDFEVTNNFAQTSLQQKQVENQLPENDSPSNLSKDIENENENEALPTTEENDLENELKLNSASEHTFESNIVGINNIEDKTFNDNNALSSDHEQDGFKLIAQIDLDNINPDQDETSQDIIEFTETFTEIFQETIPKIEVHQSCSFKTSQSRPISPSVVINEVAWMGTLNSPTDEWVELMAINGNSVDISGWQLIDVGEQINVVIDYGTVLTPANPFYLLERTNDNSVPGIDADQIYKGALGNTKEGIRFFDSGCNLVDEVFANPSWPAGSSEDKLSMERSRQSLGWQTYFNSGDNDSDVLGTPRKLNSMPPNSGGQISSTAPPSPSTSPESVPEASSPPPPSQEEDGSTDTPPPPPPTPPPPTPPPPTPPPTPPPPAPDESDVFSSANHLLISEVYSDATGANEDFVELYNPTNNEIDISGWSIQVLSANAPSYESIKKKNFVSGNSVAPLSFFLVGIDDYPSLGTEQFPAADMVWKSGTLTNSGASIFLVSISDPINEEGDVNIIDNVAYGSGDGLHPSEYSPTQKPEVGESLERKAYKNECLTAQEANEFIGNGCDTNNNATNFSNRANPKPQNTSNLPEPRDPPLAVSDFNVSYNPSSLQLFLNWDSQDNLYDVNYHIYAVNSPEELVAVTNVQEYQHKVKEVGREYNYEIEVVDVDGMKSTREGVSFIPKFLNNVYFYNYKDSTNSGPVIDLRFDDYPFIPNIFDRKDTWTLIVFYLNTEPLMETILHTKGNWQPSELENVLALGYPNCAGGGGEYLDFSAISRNSLMLPDVPSRCTSDSGVSAGRASFSFGLIEDNRILLPTVSSEEEKFTSEDYITLAYYALYHSGGGTHNFSMVAVDKQKYYYQESLEKPNEPPTNPKDFQVSVNELYEPGFTWEKSTDPDGLDSNIIYEFNYSELITLNPLEWTQNLPKLILEPGKKYIFGLRAKDIHGNYSDPIISEYVVPRQKAPFSITDVRWGFIDENDPEKLKLSMEFDKYPIVQTQNGGQWPSTYPLSAIIFHLNQYPPVSGSFSARNNYTPSTSIGDGSPRIGFSYYACGASIKTVSAILMNDTDIEDACDMRDDALNISEILMPTDSELGKIIVDITVLYSADKTISELTSEDFITMRFLNAYNGGSPRGTFQTKGIDRNKYYFEE